MGPWHLHVLQRRLPSLTTFLRIACRRTFCTPQCHLSLPLPQLCLPKPPHRPRIRLTSLSDWMLPYKLHELTRLNTSFRPPFSPEKSHIMCTPRDLSEHVYLPNCLNACFARPSDASILFEFAPIMPHTENDLPTIHYLKQVRQDLGDSIIGYQDKNNGALTIECRSSPPLAPPETNVL